MLHQPLFLLLALALLLLFKSSLGCLVKVVLGVFVAIASATHFVRVFLLDQRLVDLLVVRLLCFVDLDGFQEPFGGDFVHLLVSEAETDVFRLQVRVNHLANAVQVVEADQALLCYLSHNWERCALVVVSFDYFEQVHAQNFKDCNKVLTMWSVVEEAVK